MSGAIVGAHKWWFCDNKLPGYSWYVPKEGGFLNIGVGGIADNLKSSELTIKIHWDVLVKKLRKLELVENKEFHPRGYVYYVRHNRVPIRLNNIFLVGDSIGLATRDMGEGIGPAIWSGSAAAEAITNGSPYNLEAIRSYSGVLPLTGWLPARWLQRIFPY